MSTTQTVEQSSSFTANLLAGGYSDSEDDEPLSTTPVASVNQLENVSHDTMQSGPANVTKKDYSSDAQSRPNQSFNAGPSAVPKTPTPSPTVPNPANITPAEDCANEPEDKDNHTQKSTPQFSKDIYRDDGHADFDLPGGGLMYQEARALFIARSKAQPSRKSPRRDDDEVETDRKLKARKVGGRQRDSKLSEEYVDSSDADIETDDEEPAATSPSRDARSSIFGGSSERSVSQHRTTKSIFGNGDSAPQSLFGTLRQPARVEEDVPRSLSVSLHGAPTLSPGAKTDSLPSTHGTCNAADPTVPLAGSDAKVTEFTFAIDDPEQGCSPRNAISQGLLDMHIHGSGSMCDDIGTGGRDYTHHLNSFDRDRSSSSPSPPSSPRALDPNPEPYELRKNIDRKIKGSYIDGDKTGNYDPEEETRQRELERQKTKQRKKKSRQPKQPAVQKKSKLIMRFKFPGLGYGNVRNRALEKLGEDGKPLPTDTAGNGNFSRDYEELDDEEKEEERERVERWKQMRVHEQYLRQHMRERTPGVKVEHDPILDTLKKETKKVTRQEDLTNHPEARGCQGCRRDNIKCSMRLGGTWPCDRCDGDKDKCELFVPPPPGELGKCNHCLADCEEDEENLCSFEMEGLAPHDKCKQCVKEEHPDCVPAIPKGYKAPRILDLDELAYGPNRQYLNCAICRADKAKCSVNTRGKTGPCTRCRKNGWGCTFDDVPSQERLMQLKHDKKQGHWMDDTAVEEEEGNDEVEESTTPESPTPEADPNYFEKYLALDDVNAGAHQSPAAKPDTSPIYMTDADGNHGPVTKIKTSFLHPIKFKTGLSDATDEGCEFCTYPTHGFVGVCEKEVDVLQWDTGLGFTEFHKRYEDGGEPGTEMCPTCTTNRVQIVACPGHDLVEFRGSGKTFDEAANGLIEMAYTAEPADIRLELQYFCSLCFSLAKYRCCQEAPDLADEDDEPGMLNGCGLTLCKMCTYRLRDEFRMNLSEAGGLAEFLDKQPKFEKKRKAQPYGCVRADVGFLAQSGLLIANMNAPDDGDDDDNQGGVGEVMAGQVQVAEEQMVQEAWASSGFGPEFTARGGYGSGFMNRDEDTMDWE